MVLPSESSPLMARRMSTVSTYELQVRQAGAVPVPAQEISFSEESQQNLTPLQTGSFAPTLHLPYRSCGPLFRWIPLRLVSAFPEHLTVFCLNTTIAGIPRSLLPAKSDDTGGRDEGCRATQECNRSSSWPPAVKVT
jgi:hypothetical protein